MVTDELDSAKWEIKRIHETPGLKNVGEALVAIAYALLAIAVELRNLRLLLQGQGRKT